MYSTYTRSETTTYTEARARYVLQKAWDDIVGMMAIGCLSKESAQKWYKEIKYLLDLQALKKFEFKVKKDGVLKAAWRYEVISNGSIYEDSDSGGVDLSGLDSSYSVSIVVDLTNDNGKEQEALTYLHSNGWGDGSFTDKTMQADRSFSKEGYGIARSIYKA